jgi:hypothetical protein
MAPGIAIARTAIRIRLAAAIVLDAGTKAGKLHEKGISWNVASGSTPIAVANWRAQTSGSRATVRRNTESIAIGDAWAYLAAAFGWSAGILRCRSDNFGSTTEGPTALRK